MKTPQSIGWAILAACMAGCSGARKETPILIGHVYFDEDEVAGVRAAVDDLNAETAKRPLGRSIKAIHVSVKENDLASQANRLLQLNRVGFLIGGRNLSHVRKLSEEIGSEGALLFTTAGKDGTFPQPNVFWLGVAGGAPTPTAVELTKRQTEAAGKTPGDGFLANYAAVEAIVAAIRSADSDVPARVREEISKQSAAKEPKPTAGIYGPYLFTKDGSLSYSTAK